MKSKALIIATFVDVIIDLSMKLVGIYIFYFEGDWVCGSIIFGMSGIYSLSMVAGGILSGRIKKDSFKE